MLDSDRTLILNGIDSSFSQFVFLIDYFLDFVHLQHWRVLVMRFATNTNMSDFQFLVYNFKSIMLVSMLYALKGFYGMVPWIFHGPVN